MTKPATDPKPAADPLLRSARREALVVLVVWAAATIYTVGYCYVWGYDRPADELRFVFGVPDWIFWGIVAPWFACLAFTCWFAFWFMQDADLEAESRAGDAASQAEVEY